MLQKYNILPTAKPKDVVTVSSTNISFQDKKYVFWDLDLQVSHQMALYNIVDMDAKQQVGDQHRFSRLHGSKETTTV